MCLTYAGDRDNIKFIMTVGLFIPCYVNQFYPNAAKATLELLQKFGVNVVYPIKQTCCGQPMANSGFEYLSQDCNEIIIENFSGFDGERNVLLSISKPRLKEVILILA